MKIKTNNVPNDCDYLTNGKEYEFTHMPDCKNGGIIIADDGGECTVYIPRSGHLNGASWEIVK